MRLHITQKLLLVLLFLIFLGIYWLISKKLNIETKILSRYKHVNKIHKKAEILLLIVSFVIIVLINPASFGSHFVFIFLTLLSAFRAYMEWKFEKISKRYILSIFAASFFLIFFLGIEFVFSNPVPVRLEADQVEEITIEHYSDEGSNTIAITDKGLIKPILSALSDGQYQIGTHPITPRLLFPRDMMMFSQELELIFEDFAENPHLL